MVRICSATLSRDRPRTVISVLSGFTFRAHPLRTSPITGSRSPNQPDSVLMKSASSAYAISNGKPRSDDGRALAVAVLLTSRKAASRYTTNRTGDKESPWGVPIVIDRDSEDVSRREQLAAAAFRSLWSLWSRRSTVGEELRLRLYNAFVLPVLVYNAGTWGLTAAAEGGLDAFHRGQLCSLIGFVWPQKIATTALYDRCKAEPISRIITRARWRLFGHILRLPSDAPAVLSMVSYFQCDDHKWRGRPRITLPVKLDDDLHRAACGRWQSLEYLKRLSDVAAVRSEWRQLLDMICK